MIIDTLENINLYKGLGNLFLQGFEYLENTDLATLPTGKYTIDGENVFAIVMEYETGNTIEIEAHQKYADIQFIISGEEMMLLKSKTGEEKIIQAYNDKEDYMLYEAKTSNYVFTKGMFAVFFPDDLHSPSMMIDHKSSKVKKVVVKVKLH